MLCKLLFLLAVCNILAPLPVRSVSVYTAIKNAGYTKFIELVDKGGLIAALNTSDTCNTYLCMFVVVPTNAAITAKYLTVDAVTGAQCKDIVDRHFITAYRVKPNTVVKGLLNTWENYISDAVGKGGTIFGKSHIIQTQNSLIYWAKTTTTPPVYFANNGRFDITSSNGDSDNGIFHVIDELIDPTGSKTSLDSIVANPSSISTTWIAQITKSLEMIKTLKDADTARGYLYNALLGSSGHIVRTLFLPSNAAWEAVPADKSSILTTNLTLGLWTFSTFFGLDEIVFTSWLKQRATVNLTMGITDSGVGFPPSLTATLNRKADGTTYITAGGVTAQIVLANIPLLDTVIHVIDRPLNYIYDTLAELTQKYTPNFYQECNKESRCMSMLTSTTNTYTLFAPEDVSSISSLTGENRWNILRLHFIPGQRVSKVEMTSAARFDAEGNVGNIRFRQSTNTTTKVEGRLTGNGFVSGQLAMSDYAATNGMFHTIKTPLGQPTKNIIEFLRDNPDIFSTLYSYVGSGFTPNLGTVSPVYTVFAATNAAISEFSSYRNSEGFTVGSEILKKQSLRDRIFRRVIIPNQRINVDVLSGTNSFGTGNTEENELLTLAKRASSTGTEITITAVGVSVTVDPNKGIYACTNGLVYEIDKLLYRDKDLEGYTVGASMQAFSVWTLLLSLLLSTMLASLLAC